MMRSPVGRATRCAVSGLVAAGIAITAVSAVGAWTTPNADLASTRAISSGPIRAATVGRLDVRWRFPLDGRGAAFGAVTATPVVARGVVYLQDARSNVHAISLASGRELWRRKFAAPNDGPNGLTVRGGRVYGATDTTVFALAARDGARLWQRRLTRRTEQFVNIAPVIANGMVYVSTVGFAPGGRGAIYALRAGSGRIAWRFDTIRDPWRDPAAGGGGAWLPLSIDGGGRVYAGISNPGPWGGTPAKPNGGAFPGAALYSDSLVVLDGRTGGLLWYDQVTPHDVRDYDFQASPILATVRSGGRQQEIVVGAGKGGVVVAWDRTTRTRLWSASVGTHLHDVGPLPRTPTRVCPGLFGGVLTPMAYASRRLFVPVVELCMTESATRSHDVLQRPPEEGQGLVYALDVATGRTVWRRPLPSAPFGCATVSRDLVFVPTFDGRVVALSTQDGRTLWSTRLRAGINACPAVAGGVLLVAAGARHRAFSEPRAELVAYALRQA